MMQCRKLFAKEVDRWLDSRYATWDFRTFYKELEIERLKEEKGVLRGKKGN